MRQNLVDIAKRDDMQGEKVIPTNQAAKMLRISYALFDKLMDKASNRGLIRYQARIDDRDSSRPILGFEVPYLEDILEVLGDERGPGKVIFTNQAKQKIERINHKWSKQYKIMR